MKTPKCEIQPWPNRIIVEQVAAKETTKGGLHLPDKVQTPLPMGRIVAAGKYAGPYPEQYPPYSELVDRFILFDEFAGRPIKVDEKVYMMLMYEDVSGFIPEP